MGGHEPVLYRQTVEALKLEAGMTVADGTLGGGGHARGILERILPGGRLVGIDRDADAIGRCRAGLKEYGESVVLVRGNFKRIAEILGDLRIERIDGALLDLGVSSFQLDEAERGFSYHQDAPLDMRMDRNGALTAADVVNGYSEEDLFRVIREYGEERWAARIAAFVAERRKTKRIGTTDELVRVIKQAIPRAVRSDGAHPARKTFQAIRVEVNGELDGLGRAIEEYARALRGGGRLAVITFHSLEDRIVKQTFKKLIDPCECPKDFPVCVCGKTSTVRAVTRKPIMPEEGETASNPRARSAKLRVIEKR